MQGGANLLLTNNAGCTVLHLLMGCEVSHDEKPLFRILVNDIIRSFRFNMNARNSAGATALHIAASRGYRYAIAHFALVDYLLMRRQMEHEGAANA